MSILVDSTRAWSRPASPAQRAPSTRCATGLRHQRRRRVTPGKGGQNVDGIPVFNTIHEAVEEQGANTAMIFVPPRFAADSILEAEDAGIELIIAITEGIPAHDEMRVFQIIKKERALPLVGPNCPGILSPARRTSHHPAAFFKQWQRRPGVPSGTLTYQVGNELALQGFGNSTIVGIGGDPVPGSDFIDVLGMSKTTRRPS